MDLCNFFYPWTFLFTGLPYSKETQNRNRLRWRKIDDFCDLFKWDNDARVLLSLAASNIESLDSLQIEDICSILSTDVKEQAAARDLLKKLLMEEGK